MKFLVLGGSGKTGQMIIDEALSRGHQVTALVRTASSLPARKGLTVVKGTPLQASDVESALNATSSSGSEPVAVLVALAARRTSGSPFAAPSPDTPPRLMADSVANAVAALKRRAQQRGVSSNSSRGSSGERDRIVIMSAQGTGSSLASLNCAMRAIFQHTNMRHQQVDHEAVDAETRAALADPAASGVDFTIVRPAMLVDADKEGAEVRTWPDDGRGAGFWPVVARPAIARFLVRVAADQTGEFAGRSPVVTN